ncbi:hypothetical protein GRF61_15410 [Azoarcus sp. TTM-91]|uniref:hypothetical protein n=1 Tax=Azoarcus sp. TTM-91 TaxID=2691581 RepID=UPI00145FA3AB|nr:hypothetical protein [Azoarcus sp. TTM-91]NMG35835.1 hypothetical protein [Azoarcus sp. TTM-91]
MIPSPMQYLATNLVAFVAGMVFVVGLNAYGKRMKASGERAARTGCPSGTPAAG